MADHSFALVPPFCFGKMSCEYTKPMLGPECEYSFADLFRAAEGRDWTEEEAAGFASLTQAEKNDWVTKLAAKAPEFTTQDKIGTDGVTYRAFWIETD